MNKIGKVIIGSALLATVAFGGKQKKSEVVREVREVRSHLEYWDECNLPHELGSINREEREKAVKVLREQHEIYAEMGSTAKIEKACVCYSIEEGLKASGKPPNFNESKFFDNAVTNMDICEDGFLHTK
ncbi:hypothetical protein R83H12_01898 [Fibrobacteria bacterium R8-3-H12]